MSVHKKKQQQCDVCGKQFSERMFLAHVLNHQETAEDIWPDQRDFEEHSQRWNKRIKL